MSELHKCTFFNDKLGLRRSQRGDVLLKRTQSQENQVINGCETEGLHEEISKLMGLPVTELRQCATNF